METLVERLPAWSLLLLVKSFLGYRRGGGGGGFDVVYFF
jgi:hypothetical protein